MATAIGFASMSRNQTKGSLSVNFTVYLSGASTFSTALSMYAYVAGDRHEAHDAVAHVVGRQLAPVDRRLRLPADPSLELEDARRVVRLRPRLGEIALDRKAARRHARPRLVLEQAAVGEAERRVRLEVAGEHRVEVGRIPAAGGERPAPLRCLRGRRPGREYRPGQRRAAQCKGSRRVSFGLRVTDRATQPGGDRHSRSRGSGRSSSARSPTLRCRGATVAGCSTAAWSGGAGCRE